MGPNETEKLLHSKENYKQGEKTALRLGENVCKWFDQQGVDIQNIQTAHTIQHQKANQKSGQKTWTDIFHRRHTYGQQAFEKLLNNANYYRNYKYYRNYYRLSPKYIQMKNDGEDVEKREACTLLVGM